MFPNKDSSFLILGAGGFVGSYIRGLCDVLDLRYIGTSRGCRDGLISLDAGDSHQWARLEKDLEKFPVTAIIDLVAPNVSPVRRLERIQPSLYTYPERVMLLAERMGIPIVHVGTDLPKGKKDPYGTFKDIIVRSFLSGGNRVTVITEPRLIGVGLSQHFLAGTLVKAAIEEKPVPLEDPEEVRGFLSVRTAAQEIICAALEGPRHGGNSFLAERQYLSTADFHSKVLSIYERLKAQGSTFASGEQNPKELNKWTRECWNAILKSPLGNSQNSFKVYSYTLDEEIEAMFRRGEG